MPKILSSKSISFLLFDSGRPLHSLSQKSTVSRVNGLRHLHNMDVAIFPWWVLSLQLNNESNRNYAVTRIISMHTSKWRGHTGHTPGSLVCTSEKKGEKLSGMEKVVSVDFNNNDRQLSHAVDLQQITLSVYLIKGIKLWERSHTFLKFLILRIMRATVPEYCSGRQDVYLQCGGSKKNWSLP